MSILSRPRSFFAFFFPLFMGLLLLLIFWGAADYYQNKKSLDNQSASLMSMQSVLGKIQSEFSLSRQIESSFRLLLDTFRSLDSHDSVTGQQISELYSQCMPKDLAKHCKLWLFARSGKNFSLVEQSPFVANKKGAMTRVFSSLVDLADSTSEEGSARSRERFIAGIFGENSVPQYLASERCGRLTPVIFEGRQHYLYWQKFEENGQCNGGFLAVFPGIFIENKQIALKRLANKLFAESSGNIVVAFAGPPELQAQFPPIWPDRVATQSAPRTILQNSIEKLAHGSAELAQRKIHFSDGYWFYFDSFANESPYNAYLCYRDSSGQKTQGFIPVGVISAAIYCWCAFYWFRLRNGGLSLGIAFRLLFFLTAMLPVMLLAILGLNFIDQVRDVNIRTRINTSFSRLALMNEKTEDMIALSALVVKDALNENALQENLISNKPADNRNGYDTLAKHLKKTKFSLSYLLLMKPGKPLECFATTPGNVAIGKYYLEFYAASSNAFHLELTKGCAGSLPLVLTASQKALVSDFGSEEKSASNIFISSLEKINVLEGVSSSKLLTFSGILLRHGKIEAYLAIGLSVSEAVLDILIEELGFAANNNDDSYLCINRDMTFGRQIYPKNNQKFLHSSSGQRFLKFLESAATSKFQMQLRDQDAVFIYEPLQKVKTYYAGALINIKDINQERDLKLIWLAILLALLAGAIYLLSAAVSKVMIEPTKRLAAVFLEIAGGNYEQGFSYEYENELGILSKATTAMVSGLKQRKLLGKFVSRTFDSEILANTSRKAAQQLNGVILFSDIRSFTTISEQNPSDKVGQMLNNHLKFMVEVIQQHGGQVEQFIGDAIVAFFPGDGEFSCQKAVRGAVLMMKQHHEIIERRKQQQLITYEIGIGLEYGLVMAGILKSGSRSEFAVIGPARARAEEFEGETKNGNFTRIIAGKSIVDHLPSLSESFVRHNAECYEVKNLEVSI